MDTSPSHPSPPTPMVGEMHKEAQKATGGPTSLGDTSKDGAHPQLSSGSNTSVLVDKTKSARDGLKTTHTTSSANKESRADDISRNVKLEDLADVLKDTRSAFLTPDSLIDEPIIVSAPLKIIGLSGEIKELKQHIKDMEIKLLRDLNDIPSKLETFTSNISNLSSHVAELKNIQWELPVEFLDLPHLASSVQKKIKTLDSLANKATASPAEGEKDTNKNLKIELVDLLGIDIITQYYNKNLLYERYCEKINKIRQISKIINYDLLTKKGLISLKVYREDGTAEVIEKFKANDLQLVE
nr:hypothetical protein [Tanacetum cinerariifolium]